MASSGAAGAQQQRLSDHEQYADAADDYLDQHNVYELFSSLMRRLVIAKPKDPLSFLLSALEQPAQQLRVLVVTPPHATSSAVLSRAVRELGLLSVRLSTLVAEESALGSPLGVQAKAYLDRGEAVPDQIAVPLLAARLSKADAMGKGWVLAGYPTTRAQALALQAGGVLPTHLLYFTTPATAAAAGASAGTTTAAAAAAAATAQSDPAAATAAANYVRHGAQVQEVFAHVAHFFDLSKSAEDLFQQLANVLNASPRTRAPKRPLRVLLLGAKGSGKHTQAGLLARKYGLVHINAMELLKREMARVPALRERAKQYLSNGMLVPDEIVSPLVVARLLSPDAKKAGFVLEGFPRTIEQAQALEGAGVRPNRVVHLLCEEEEARRRVVCRRIDPDTGDVYSFDTEDDAEAGAMPGLPQAVRDRLVQRDGGQGHAVEAVNFTIASHIDALQQRYKAVWRSVASPATAATQQKNTEAAKLAVFEQIEDFLLAPLNAAYAHKQNAAGGAAASVAHPDDDE